MSLAGRKPFGDVVADLCEMHPGCDLYIYGERGRVRLLVTLRENESRRTVSLNEHHAAYCDVIARALECCIKDVERAAHLETSEGGDVE